MSDPGTRSAPDGSPLERRFRALIERSADAIALIDADAKVLYASPSTERVLGYTGEELMGMNALALVHPEDRAGAERHLAAVLASGDSRLLETRILHKTSGWIWVEGSANNLLADPDVAAIVVNYRDVTDRKAAADLLRASEERYRALFETTLDGILLVNDAGEYVDVNESYCRLLKRTRSELIGRRFSEVIAPPLLERAARAFQELKQCGTLAVEFPMLASDGTLVELEWRSRTNILPGLHLCVAREISERKRHQAELARADERFRNLADSAPVMIWVSNSGNLCTWFNRRWLEFTGRTMQQESGNGWLDGVHPEDRTRCRETYTSACEARRDFEIQYRLRRHDGGYRWVLNSGVPSFSVGGDFDGYTGSCIDVTELKEAEERSSASETKLRAYFEAAAQGIVTVTEDGRMEEVNARMESLFGYRRDQLVGRELDMLLPQRIPGVHAGHMRRFFAEPRTRPMGSGLELAGRRSDGTEFPVEIGLSYVRTRDGLRGIAFITDITERKRSEAAIRETQKLESLGVLAGGIAHDFNNLLVGVMGNASLLEGAGLPSDGEAAVAQILAASQRAADLTRQLLAYAGKGRFIVRPLNLSELVHGISALIRASIPKNVHVTLNLADDLPFIEGDPVQVQQVVMNLIINAAEAIPAKQQGVVSVTTLLNSSRQLTGRVHADARERPDGRYVVLEVTDTGVGMDEATEARIFDPFFTTKFMGRGLGLSAVQGIVRGHKGALHVTSEPGKGSTFQVAFPEAGGKPAAQAIAVVEEAAGSGTVLLVDDEEIVRRTAGASLARYGYTVLTAENGRTAVDTFRARWREISLVLLDLTMPDMGGEETLMEMQAIQPDVCVLLSSGYNEVEAIQYFHNKGLAGFIQKPYSASALARKIKSVLASWKRR